jgi:hypothetical protein
VADAELLYRDIYRRHDMSTKWMGCLKHILTHATSASEKPSESPTDAATLSVRPTIYQVGVASL